MKTIALAAAIVLLSTSAQAQGRPPGCPSAWCGCWLSEHLFGHHVPALDAALSWLKFKRTTPHVGAVAVMKRRGGGHVGVVTAIDGHGNPTLLSGNHGHKVGTGVYPKNRILAYVEP